MKRNCISSVCDAGHQFHSCLEAVHDDAKWLYNGVIELKILLVDSTRTTVIIIDYLILMKRMEWIDLTSNKNILDLPENPMAVEEALIPIIQIPKSSRGVLKNRERYLYAEDSLRARGVIRENVRLIPSIDFNKLRKQKALEKQKKEEDKLKKMKAKS